MSSRPPKRGRGDDGAASSAKRAAKNNGSAMANTITGGVGLGSRSTSASGLSRLGTPSADLGPKAVLTLKDGTVVNGVSFGALKAVSGEVVFNTGMVGYPEALTDPSYRGQILVLTYPLVGNYGVPNDDVDEYGLPKHFESSEIHISGLIVASYANDYSHWNAARSLGDWLVSKGVPAIHMVDTRMLTKHLREAGSMLGKLEVDGAVPRECDFVDPNVTNLVAEVSRKESVTFNKGNTPRILAYDCGMKNNIIRFMLNIHKVQLTIVPFDYDLEKNPEKIEWDGLFISNGPGNPEMASACTASIKWALALEPPKPIFGICLGNQLMALAAGATTYKLKYGNRSMNQPCIDMRTTKCYTTPQNHGFAVSHESLPEGWRPFFINANDKSNEGIIHTSKPFFSAQFHPEASGGPMDTAFLFDMFVSLVQGAPPQLTVLDPMLYDTPNIRKVLLVGSGGLSIGQAGEFDYSGSQAIKALKEEGLEVILINPNIATVQTSKISPESAADKVYFVPISRRTVLEVIKREKPDGIIVSMGGQTALNVGIELWEANELQENNVKVLGTPIQTIIDTEDREIFSTKLKDINETLARSISAVTVEQAVEAARKIGFPVLLRTAFALGGLGSGFAANERELRDLAEKGLSCSHQLLIDQDLRGWKELEYEVVRDRNDNCITVCNMENFDPLGVHTGDSIVVAPSQTLTNREYFMLRSAALKVVRHLGIVGECNIQYALNPESEEYCIIEVNARLSRSSALASKATGYPLAFVAAKLSLGIDLVSIKNSVTKTTTACFEPSLDYCVVKMPKWDLKKFSKVSTKLGSAMKSIGEVMAIGRTFEEAIQKAVRMVSPSSQGLDGYLTGDIPIDLQLSVPTEGRLAAVQYALENGHSVEYCHTHSRIDRWFLNRLKHIASLKEEVLELGSLEKIDTQLMKLAKRNGFSDRQIGTYTKSDEAVVRRRRLQQGVTPVVKQIDTLAAEFPAQTNYLYLTYAGDEHDVEPAGDAVCVLGCGPYCIGSSVEFDWSAVSCVRQVRASGHRAIVINCNPETVSTDYDQSDRLYFEELSLERVMDIYEHERVSGVIVSVGGQGANNLAKPLHMMGCNILGTSADNIDRAEDRNRFSAMLDSIGIDQPPWREATDLAEAQAFAAEVGYPVLLRPSFVLSGAAMNVASTQEQLENFLSMATEVSGDKPVVVSKYIMNAKEIEFDGVADGGRVLNYAISEHVENAGVHSGDATLVLPAQKLFVQTIRNVKRIAQAIAASLDITGPFNLQLMARENEVKVIECNLRASRTFPFVSKTLNANFISLATRAILGEPARPYNISLMDIDYVGVKAPMFSFTRLRGADPTLGVEMSSTGEVACFGHDIYEAYILALQATGFKLPSMGGGILVSIAADDISFSGRARDFFTEHLQALAGMGYTLYGTPGTATFYNALTLGDGSKLNVIPLDYGPTGLINEGEGAVNGKSPVLEAIRSKKVELVVNIPAEKPNNNPDSVTNGYQLRRAAVDFSVSLVTNIKCAILLVESMQRYGHELPTLRCMDDFYQIGKDPETKKLGRSMSLC